MRAGAISVRELRADDFPFLSALFGERGACGGCWCMAWRLEKRAFEAGKGESNRRALKRLVESGEARGCLAFAGDEPVGWCSVGPRSDFAALARMRALRRGGIDSGRQLDDQPRWPSRSPLHPPPLAGSRLAGSVALRADEPLARRHGSLRRGGSDSGRDSGPVADWDARTWCVTCFFIRRDFRGRGVAVALLKAAVELARGAGAACLEGYPAAITAGLRGGKLPAAFAWTGVPEVFERAGFRALEHTPGKRPIYVRALRQRRAAAEDK